MNDYHIKFRSGRFVRMLIVERRNVFSFIFVGHLRGKIYVSLHFYNNTSMFLQFQKVTDGNPRNLHDLDGNMDGFWLYGRKNGK